MANTSPEKSPESFDEADFEKMVQDVFTTNPHSESTPNNLSGSIHPIFSHSNWHIHPTISQHDSDGEEFFKLMDPVRHLASNLLLSPKSRLFLTYLFYAVREPLTDLSKKLGRPLWQLNPMEDIDYSEAVVRTDPLLDYFARYVNFHWYDPANPINDDERCGQPNLGFCKIKVKAPIRMSAYQESTGYMSTIYLNLDMYTKLKDLHLRLRDSSLDEVEGISSQILRLQFVMAVSTCHELVHACNMSVKTIHGDMEPFFENERIAELGHAWEGFVIGGTISVREPAAGSNRSEQVAENALLLIKWPDFARRGTAVSMERALPFPFQNNFFIPMDWIVRIQQEQEWQSSTTPEEVVALLEIPKTLGYTEAFNGDDFDPDWKSKWVNELEYIRPEKADLEPKGSSAPAQKTIDPEPEEEKEEAESSACQETLDPGSEEEAEPSACQETPSTESEEEDEWDEWDDDEQAYWTDEESLDLEYDKWCLGPHIIDSDPEESVAGFSALIPSCPTRRASS